MAGRAVHPFREAEGSHQGEPLIDSAEGAPAAGATEGLALPEAAERERESRDQEAGNEDQMNDGNGERNDGTAETRRQGDTRPLEPVAGAEDADVDFHRARGRAHPMEGHFNGTQLHRAFYGSRIDICLAGQRPLSSSGYFRA